MSQIVLAQRGGKTLEMMQQLKRKYAAVETENEQLRQQLATEQAKSKEIWQELLELRAEHESDRQECSACYEHKASLEATIAAMRSALENLLSKIEDGDDCYEDVDGMNGFLGKTIPPSCMEIFEAEQALSNTANTEYAERVKKLEEALRLVLRRYHKLDSETVATIKDALGEGKHNG